MSEKTEYVCKHCGGDKFSANVVLNTSARVFVRERDGKPEARVDDIEAYGGDVEVDVYLCDGCDASEFKFADLVKQRGAADELRAPCGRCDHDALDHPLPETRLAKYPEHYTRPAMRCTVAGCDCHDYYDTALALAA